MSCAKKYSHSSLMPAEVRPGVYDMSMKMSFSNSSGLVYLYD